MNSKLQKHLKKYDINYVPMDFNGRKILWMKQGRSAGSAMYYKVFVPYIESCGGWCGGQTSSNKDERSQNWLSTLTDDELKNEYFTFTFVRNPFSRVVSCWGGGQRHARGMKCSPDFDYFIKSELWREDRDEFNGFHNPHYAPASVHSEYDNGEMFIDWFGKVENIQKDWKTLYSKIPIPQVDLPIVKSGHTVKNDYRFYYTDELIEIVAKYYKRDLELFDYEF